MDYECGVGVKQTQCLEKVLALQLVDSLCVVLIDTLFCYTILIVVEYKDKIESYCTSAVTKYTCK
jgi:hypothetical protein